jgi:hypothetical protein
MAQLVEYWTIILEVPGNPGRELKYFIGRLVLFIIVLYEFRYFLPPLASSSDVTILLLVCYEPYLGKKDNSV